MWHTEKARKYQNRGGIEMWKSKEQKAVSGAFESIMAKLDQWQIEVTMTVMMERCERE